MMIIEDRNEFEKQIEDQIVEFENQELEKHEDKELEKHRIVDKSLFLFETKIPFFKIEDNMNQLVLVVKPEHLLISLAMLKKHVNYRYEILTCISGVDLLDNSPRFCVVYELLSVIYSSRIKLKVYTDDETSIPSATAIYVNADWWEREIWDMYGIYFSNHPQLRRILTDYGFEHYPLRKDFPLSGYIEVQYDLESNRVISKPLELTQEFRLFNNDTPW